MIPAEAVEAAAKRYYEASNYGRKWDLAANSDKATERHRIRLALEAASPYLLAPAWNLGLTTGIRCERGDTPTSPYEAAP